MPSLKQADNLAHNELRAESALMNTLLSAFAFTEPTAWISNGKDIKCQRIPDVSYNQLEGLCCGIIDLPINDGVYDFSPLAKHVTDYRNSSSFFAYVTDRTCSTYHTANVIIGASMTFTAATYLRLGRYPNQVEMEELRNALNIPGTLIDPFYLASYMWIAMHERGWFHQDDIAEFDLMVSCMLESPILITLFLDTIATLDSIRKTAKSSKVQGSVREFLDTLPEEAKASYAMLLTTVTDLSEYTGTFYDPGFNNRYQKSRGLQIAFELGYYAQEAEAE